MTNIESTKKTYSTAIQARIDRYEAAVKVYNLPCPSIESFNNANEERLLGLRTGYGPLVGMPCTYEIGADSYAAEVVWVSKSDHQIRVRTEHDVKDLPGKLFTRRKDGDYRTSGSGCGYISFLVAKTHLDPSF